MNTLKNLTNKEMVNKIKDYADIADVAYAFFWVYRWEWNFGCVW